MSKCELQVIVTIPLTSPLNQEKRQQLLGLLGESMGDYLRECDFDDIEKSIYFNCNGSTILLQSGLLIHEECL